MRISIILFSYNTHFQWIRSRYALKYKFSSLTLFKFIQTDIVFLLQVTKHQLVLRDRDIRWPGHKADAKQRQDQIQENESGSTAQQDGYICELNFQELKKNWQKTSQK